MKRVHTHNHVKHQPVTQRRQRTKSNGEVSEELKDRRLCELELQQTVCDSEIAALEKIRDELEESLEGFMGFYVQAPIPYITINRNGYIKEANAAAEALFQFDRARLKRFPFVFVVNREDIPSFQMHLSRCHEAKGRKVMTELRLRTKRRDDVRVQLISVTVNKGGHDLFLTSIIDLSERDRNERALSESKEFSESIVETVSQPLAVLDADLKIVSVNRAFVQFFQKPAEYAKGRIFEVMLNLWWSGNALRAELEKVLVGGSTMDSFLIETEPPGLGRRILLLNARRLYHTSGSVPLVLVAIDDITARKQAEDQLRELNQELEHRVVSRTEALKKSYEQMESFCYSIAHDLRAPLRAMTGFSNLLLEQYAPQIDEHGRDFTRRIHESAARMDALIKDLLSYGRLNTTDIEMQDVNLDETFRSMLANEEEEIKERRAKVSKEGHLPRVRGHPVVLQAVLTNLVSNALKFVAPGVRPAVSIRSEERGQFTRVWVEDNGIGIPSEYRGKIFGVFQRLHSGNTYPGTGIGLAIVHKGVERMGGRVGVESEVNKGSRFWIELQKTEHNNRHPAPKVARAA